MNEDSLLKAIIKENEALVKERWLSGRLAWKLHDAQKTIYRTLRKLPDSVRESVVLCARRFGKSYLVALLAIEDCLRNEGIVRVIGPDIKQTTNIIVPLINKIAVDAPQDLIRRTKSENKWLIGKSELVLGGFDSTNIESHRGSESISIYIEETGSSNPDQYTYAMRDVLKPQLLHTRGRVIHATTPPPVMTHPFVLETIPKAQIDEAFFRFTIYDNPLLDEDQIRDAIRESGGEESVTFRREYLCELIKDETVLVVPEFDESEHVFEFEKPEYAFYQTVMDMGGVRDKTVAVLIYYDFMSGKKMVLDERVFEANTPTTIIVSSVREMESQVGGVQSRFADVPGQIQVDLTIQHQFTVKIPPKEDWEANINSLKIAVKGGRWVVHSRCKFVIASLSSGTFNEQRTDFARTNSALGHCDGIATMMYANRVIDASNPYPTAPRQREKVFYMPNQQQSEIKPPKKFGKFK